MESNKNNFQTIKESLCNVLDVVNEENMQVRQQVEILVEENRGLRQEIGSLIEKVDVLVSLVDELKNNSKNFITHVQDEFVEELKERAAIAAVLDGEVEAESVVRGKNEEELEAKVERVGIEENEMNVNEMNVNEMNESEMNGNEMNESEMNENEMNENEMNWNEMDENEMNESEMNGNEKEREVEREDVMADCVEYAEAAEVDYKKENIYREAENSYKEDEISFELDLQEMESEEVVQELEIEEPVAPAPKILHEASKPDWYDWEVDYPAPYVEDIQDGIGFNDKILFIRELFNEDDESFASTIDKLNSLEVFKGAVEYVRANFPDWDEQGDVVYRFYMSVRRKLRK